jgi:2-(1,2-epoxy-1,2-dihydrophenyl)acetyl-CoA isomerase
MPEAINANADFEHLLVATTPEGVRTLTLNRPARLNAVNMKLADELPRALAAAASDDAVRVVVITGAGRGFCAGLDLSAENVAGMMAALNENRLARLDDLGWVGRWVLAVTSCTVPVIAAINGPAAGAGLGLALAADIRLMSAAATVTTGYVRRALCPDAGVTYMLPRLVGTARAADLILTARDLDAAEAERIGLVSQVLPAEGFAQTVTDYATRIASGPPVALALAKRLLVASPDTDLVAQLRDELQSIRVCFATQDVSEAMLAFREKRPPRFTGR